MDRTRRGLETIQPNIRKVIPIRPILGMWTADAGRDAPPGTSPDMSNCVVNKGMLAKRPGLVQYKIGNPAFTDAGSPVPVVGLFSTQRNDNSSHFIAVTTRNVYRFNVITDVWDLVPGPVLTGAGSKLVSFELSQNHIVFANFADQVQLVNLDTFTHAILSPDCPIARFLHRFNGRLNLAVTVELGDQLPYRHRWSVRDDHTDWTGIGSGFRDQAEFPAHLRGMRRIASGMALYYEKAIEFVSQVPDANAPFAYETRVTEEGLYAPFSLAGRNDRHFLLGVGNFYEFNGSQVGEIFTQVRETIYNALSATNLDRMFGVVSYDTQEYLAFVVTSGSLDPDTVWVWNYQRGIAYPWDMHHMKCAAVHRLDDALSYDETPGTYDEQNYEYDSPHTLQAYPAIFLGSDAGKVFRLTPLANSDDGETIPCRWTSHDFTSEKDFGIPGQQISLERVTVEYQGLGQLLALDFYISTNSGDTWTGPFTIIGNRLSGHGTMHFTERQIGDRIRFKFEHNTNNSGFRISRFEVELELHQSKEHLA